jgi:hypothetical protein
MHSPLHTAKKHGRIVTLVILLANVPGMSRTVAIQAYLKFENAGF